MDMKNPKLSDENFEREVISENVPKKICLRIEKGYEGRGRLAVYVPNS